MTAPGLGHMLREARERHALTIEQLSLATTIPVGDIEAIENGQIDALPRAMYRRAEVREYAEAVGLDPDVVLTQLRLAHGPGAAARRADVAAPYERSGSESPEAQRRIEPRPGHAHYGLAEARTAHQGGGGHDVMGRAARAMAVLLIGCAALMWEELRSPGIEVPLAPAMTLAEIDADTVLEEAARLAEPPAPAPTLRRALFEPRIAANGRQWPRDDRLDEGVLVVQSTPRGARVTVNGVGWGVTPVAIRYLPFGTLRVRVGKADYAMQERVVRLTPQEPSRTVRVALRALARRSVAAAAEGPSEMLVITTVPEGARVTVNGIGWGTTPVSISHLPQGTQRVRVVKDQFRSEERIVTVGAGHPSRVAITLKPVS